MSSSFRKYAKYYDQIYSDKSYNLETVYLNKIFKKKKSEILEIGCGSGNHAIEFFKLGHKITAIDNSSKMISLARKKNKKITFLKKDGSSYRSKKKFDTIILLFHVVNFFETKKNLETFFINASYNLKSGGLLIFDFINLDALKKYPPLKKSKVINLKNNLSLLRKTFPSFNKKTSIFQIKFKIFIRKYKSVIDQFLEIHRLRIHSLDEFQDSYAKLFKLHKIYKWMSFL